MYRKPDLNLTPYTKVMIDPLLVWYSPDAEYRGISTADMTRLALAFHTTMSLALEDAYPIVYHPGPGVLRLRTAMVDVVPAKPKLDTPGPLLPLINELGLHVGKRVGDAKVQLIPTTNLLVGDATIEAELLDSQTNERLVGYVERRPASKQYVTKRKDSLGPIIETFDYWAKKLRRRLDEERGMRSALPKGN